MTDVRQDLVQFAQHIEAMHTKASALEVLEVDGYTYARDRLHLVDPPAVPSPPVLVVSSLSALVGYLTANLDGLEPDGCHVHVVDATRVEVVSKLTGTHDAQRHTYARAGTAAAWTDDGKYLTQEALVLALQAQFAHTEDAQAMRNLVGNVRGSKVAAAKDDGVTQTVSTKAGVELDATTKIENPWTLAPYRTFNDVAQPASPYVLRAHKGRSDDDLPTFTLHPADNGRWRDVAVRDVADYLRDSLPADWHVIG